MTLSTGTVLNNRYRIVRLIGQGGFGAVYRAWDLSLTQPVALKENIDGGDASQRQFEHEARLLAGLRHNNLPRVIDHFILPGQGQYLVMDYVEGKSLGELLRERGGPLDEAEVLPWVRQVADALTYLHTRTPPVIHRDIKPDNIIITTDGRAVLVDFGISKLYDPNKGTTMGAKAVTPGFSPPEQYGRAQTDARSDVYSLGATLYMLLTGHLPPEAPDLSSGATELPPPRQINPAVSENVSQAVVAAMAPTISQRLPSATQLMHSMSTGVAQSTRVTPPVQSRQTLPTGRRRGCLWPVIALVLLAAGLAAGLFLTDPGQTLLDRIIPVAPTEPGVVFAPGSSTLPAATIAFTATATAEPGVATTVAEAVSKTPQPPTSAPVATDAIIPAQPTLQSTPGATPLPPTAAPPTPVPPTPTPAVDIEWAAAAGDAAVRRINQPWEQEDISLTARALEIYSQDDYNDAAARVWFRLINKTGQRVLVEIDWDTIHLEDGLGTRYNDYYSEEPTSRWVEAGEYYDFDRYYSTAPEQRSRVPIETGFVQVVVDQFSRVTNARWQFDINPVVQPVVPPAAEEAKAVGEGWEEGNVSLRLARLDVFSATAYDDAAARVWFELTNTSNGAIMAEVDFGNLFVIDGFGRHFGDWEGGGLLSRTLEAGETLEFNRYYSEMSNTFSRVTRGSAFVVVVARNTAGLSSAMWQTPLNTRLSTVDATGRTTPMAINQTWEQDGISLTARALELFAEDNYNDAAARVWFRLVNKSGQSVLIPIDRNAIYLVDDQGGRYVDFEGTGTTSVWVRSGGILDFDRYFSVAPEARSRVPGGTTAVEVVVDRFSRIANARWRYGINAQPQPVAEPAAEMVRAVGESWEQAGVALRLTGLDVFAESDYDDAAARAWFEVTNTTNEWLLVEVDYGHIYLTDSSGRRFGDWEGGGLLATWLEPGQTVEFNRYYSEMSGWRSRITRGATFVVLSADQTAGIGGALWRMDIAR